MKTAYSFIVLRYVHDIASGEFVNVGVALYAPDTKYVSAICNVRYSRLRTMFPDLNPEYFRSLMRYIQAEFEELGERLREELPLAGTPKDIAEIAQSVLPPDDSSLQWSEPGGGLSEDPAQALENLYVRLVTHYDETDKSQSRNDDDVWRVFKRPLEERQILGRLRPKLIRGQDYEYEFDHAWKNQKWHTFEPISFDLQEADSIYDKANRWLGRAVALQDSREEFKLHLLLGGPSKPSLRMAFTKAKNILHKIPGDPEFIGEDEAEQFSASLANEIQAHDEEKS